MVTNDIDIETNLKGAGHLLNLLPRRARKVGTLYAGT